jgi:glycerophosphoryl diester phosphodiesterase
VTLKEYIALGQEQGTKFTPELKEPEVSMPFGSYSLDDYRSQIVEELIEMEVPPEDVWLQSFVPEDIFWWIENYPEFGVQAVALDETALTNDEVDAWLDRLEENNVNIVAPPMSFLLEPDRSSELLMKPSYYAEQAAARGIDIITWSLERTPPGLVGFYWNSLESVIDELTEGDRLTALHVLHDQVGVIGVFADWPATTTFYANCMNLMLQNDGNDGRKISSQGESGHNE